MDEEWKHPAVISDRRKIDQDMLGDRFDSPDAGHGGKDE
jgi:hypothetical protein